MTEQSALHPDEPFGYGKWADERARDAQLAHGHVAALGRQIADAANRSGDTVLRAALVINALAALACLGFTGLVFNGIEPSGAAINKLGDSLLWFALGVAAALAGMGWAYARHDSAARSLDAAEWRPEPPFVRPTRATGYWQVSASLFEALAVIAATASIVLFLIGVLQARGLLDALA